MGLATWVWDVSSPLSAAFNGIWVKHQFMDYGWVEKAACPSLEYKQIKRPKSTKKNERPYSLKRHSLFGDKEIPPSRNCSCFGGVFLELSFPSPLKLYLSSLVHRHHRDHPRWLIFWVLGTSFPAESKGDAGEGAKGQKLKRWSPVQRSRTVF